MYYFNLIKHANGLKNKEVSQESLISLAKLLKKFNRSPPKILNLVNFDFLEGFSDLTTSITHTKNYHAVIMAKKENFLSVGIDIEFKKRMTRDEIILKIIHPNDDISKKLNKLGNFPRSQYDNLIYWTQKEASFKAVAPIHSEIKLLSQVWINKNIFGINAGKNKRALGYISTQEVVRNKKSIIVTCAFYENKNTTNSII